MAVVHDAPLVNEKGVVLMRHVPQAIGKMDVP